MNKKQTNKKKNKYLIMMQIPKALVRKIYQASRKQKNNKILKV